jgi:PKD repeat protein
MYGFTLAVIYEDPASPRKQIFINEGFDLLGADESGYATTPEEATAYIPFTRMIIGTANVSRADLITFVASGDNEGSLLFNNETLGTSVWDFGSMSGPQVAVASRDVSGILKKTGNIFAIQSTPGDTPCMAAMQQFLIVEYGNGTVNRTLAALKADFSAEPLNGTAPLRVSFTDLSTGNPTSWAWDFDNDGTIDNATQHPQYIYQASGNYTINLTVKNATASHAVNRTGYIVVTNATILSNVTVLPTEIVITRTSASELKAPSYQNTGTHPAPLVISSDVTTDTHDSGDLMVSVMSFIKGVIVHIASGLSTLSNNLPFFGGGGQGT